MAAPWISSSGPMSGPSGDVPAVLDPAHKVHLSGRATFIGRVDGGKDLRVIGGRCVVQDPELHLCVGEASTRTRRLISVATGAYLAIAMVCLALIVVLPLLFVGDGGISAVSVLLGVLIVVAVSASLVLRRVGHAVNRSRDG